MHKEEEATPLHKRWPSALTTFIDMFNRGQYWDSHEVLETPWRVNRSDFYQGLIIYASAFVHAQRGNPVGICKQMAKVPGKLEGYAPYYMGVDVAAVLEHGEFCIDFVHANPDLAGPALAEAAPYPRLQLDARLIRGDEPEFDDV